MTKDEIIKVLGDCDGKYEQEIFGVTVYSNSFDGPVYTIEGHNQREAYEVDKADEAAEIILLVRKMKDAKAEIRNITRRYKWDFGVFYEVDAE